MLFDRKKLNPSSFRGVPFETKSTSKTGGQRLSDHFFINNGTKTDDDGLDIKKFTINAFVTGEDYLEKKNALDEALNQRGTGTLTDLFHGDLEVKVESYTIDENIDEVGIAYFSMTFKLAENEVIEDDMQLITTNIKSSALKNFEMRFDNKQGLDILHGAKNKIVSFLNELESSISFISNTSANILKARDTIKDVILAIEGSIEDTKALANGIDSITSSFNDVFKDDSFSSTEQKNFTSNLATNLVSTSNGIGNRIESIENDLLYVYASTTTSILLQDATKNLVNIDFVTGDDFGDVKKDTLDTFELIEKKETESKDLEDYKNDIERVIIREDFLNELKELKKEFIIFYTQKYSRLQTLVEDEVVATTDINSYCLDKYFDFDRVDEVLQNNDIVDPIFLNGNLKVLER